MGLWHLRRGEFAGAEKYFRHAIARLTRRNPNPYDGEPYYNLGICLRYLDRDAEAYDALYKATWNQAWVAAGYHALAELDCKNGDWAKALEHLNRSLKFNTDNTRARDLMALVLRKLGRNGYAEILLGETLEFDALDWWARYQSSGICAADLQTRLDMAHDYARAGFYAEAVSLLKAARATHGDLPDQSWGAEPLVQYTLGWLYGKLGDAKSARASYQRASKASPDYCFPARLEELIILQAAIGANPKDARAAYYLGNWKYDRRRHEEGIRWWERAAKLDAKFSIVWRNFGIGYFYIRGNSRKARAAYDRAFRENKHDARLLYERDQLWKRLGEKPARRLRELEKRMDLVRQRDDLSVELCALYNHTGRHQEAMQNLSGRHFQPWEGGEGGPLGQHVRSLMALGREALKQDDCKTAAKHFQRALASPLYRGVAKHLVSNPSAGPYWAGVACRELGELEKAKQHWLAAATFAGDFQEMSVRAFSEMTYYSALARECLGRKKQARKLLRELVVYAQALAKTKAKIDYFATSLPTMLLFDDDIQFRQETTAKFLQAQAHLGLGTKAKARSLLHQVLQRDPNHALAADLLNEM